MSEQAKIIVAIESTDDYVDKDFHAEFVDVDKEFEDGCYGRNVDFYRIVTLNEDGKVVPLNNEVFNSHEEVKQYIAQAPNLKEIGYDNIIEKAGEIITKKALEKISDSCCKPWQPKQEKPKEQIKEHSGLER